MNPGRIFNDAYLIARAASSNLLANLAPSTYLKLTHQTGRGSEDETPDSIAGYFIKCFEEYGEQLGLVGEDFGNFLENREVLEYGPGDTLGVAFLFYAYGAQRVTCVDRFPMASPDRGREVLRAIYDSLGPIRQERALASLVERGDFGSGFKPECLRYRTDPRGLSKEKEQYDLIVSRAVLEHVNNLEETFKDMKRALKPGGVCIHQVDLRSHGLHRDHPLDFLSWSPVLWQLMHSGKGVPNRWRIDMYRKAAGKAGLTITRVDPIQTLSPEMVRMVRPKLAAPFQDVSDDDLAWLNFWLVMTV